jgi:cysteine desulfurase
MKSEFALYAALLILLVLVLAYFSNTRTNVFKKYAYFDYNGTTPPLPQVTKKMYNNALLGNPSGIYASAAKTAVSEARNAIASHITSDGETPEQLLDRFYVVFNSGASEGNNMVIRSIVMQNRTGPEPPHVVISAVEHKTSIDCAKQLQEEGLATITFVEPAADGTIDPASVAVAIKPETVLVSIMHFNNETGAINDISAIGQAVRAMSANLGRYIPFHSDVVQSIGKMHIPIEKYNIDAITMSFHKMYGPAGLGALVIRKTLAKDLPAQIAGTQNYGLRGGTENTAAISAIPESINTTLSHRHDKNIRLRKFKKYIEASLLSMNGAKLGNYSQYYGMSDDYDPFSNVTAKPEFDIVFIGPTQSDGLPDPERTSPNTLTFAIVKHAPVGKHFCNIELRDSLFSEHRVVVSIGSACSTSSTSGSHVLTSMKAPYIIRCGVIRISFGDTTSMSDVRKLAFALNDRISAQLNHKL